jgi:hypothetical protein
VGGLRERVLNKFWDKRLWSYFYWKGEKRLKMKNKVDLFLDSGAYSAWSQGIEIEIDDYISFIKEHKKHISVYANLDVIGDPEATLNNQKIMEKAGLKPLPCFHYGEDIKYLKYYLKNYQYIAFGGMVGTHKVNLDKWLNEMFGKYICDKEGYPKIKVHGFGLTSLSLTMKYPWYSVDSTSWVMTGRMGGVLIPVFKNGKYVYDKLPMKVSVSTTSPNLKTKDHVRNYSPLKQKTVLKYLKEKGYVLGESKFKRESVDYKLRKKERWAESKVKGAKQRRVEIRMKIGVSNCYKLRDEVNIIYYRDLEESFGKYPRKFKAEERQEGFGL